MKKIILIFLVLPFLSYGQVQIGQDIDGEAAFDFSGESVSLSSDGTIVAIGASGNSDNGISSGHVRVYENQGGSWIQIGQDIDGEAEGDASARSISLSSDGTIVAIGAAFNDSNGVDSGHVRIYENQGGNWIQIGQDINGEVEGDLFGFLVSLSSDSTIVAIGAIGNDGNGNNSGHVRIYENQDSSWTQIGQDIDGEAGSNFSGFSVSLSSDGTIVAIGAIGNNDNGNISGHARIYENQGGNWTQIGQDIDGEAEGDQFGFSVSLSSDGTIVAIGTPFNNDNGVDSGHVRIYKNQGDNWIQIGQDIDGEATFNESGRSVSLSLDGSIVAIGARLNSGNENESGHVRIFDLSGVLSTEEVSQSQFTIYPNPASTNVTIQLDQNSVLEKATIYNNLGQRVKTSIETTIDTSDLSKGMYILEVITNQGKASKKIIIE